MDDVTALQSFCAEYAKIAAEETAPVVPPLVKQVVDKLRASSKSDKTAGLMDTVKGGLHSAGGLLPKATATVKGGLRGAAEHLHHHEDAYELGGLGVLGAIGGDRLQAHGRAHAAGQTGEHNIEKRQLLGGETGHAALDTAGLGLLAAPLVAKKLLGR
jgi:hypothetical protein